MLGKLFGILAGAAMLYGTLRGQGEAVSTAVLEGASDAVSLTIALCGMMCLWCGVMRVLQEAGIISRLARMLRPLLGLIFPHAARTGIGMEEIAANLSANLLGLGNAATPFALQAMAAMAEHNPDPASATDDMIMLVVLNTASLQLLPTTLITLRYAAGSAEPYAILLPVWICSAAASAVAVLLCRFSAAWRKRP